MTSSTQKLFNSLPIDIQNKILMLIFGYGTPSAVEIKKLINRMNIPKLWKSLNTDANSKTLWRFQMWMNNRIMPRYLKCTSYEHAELLCDIRIAYVAINAYEAETNFIIKSHKCSLKRMSQGRLLEMKHGIDVFKYGSFGTQTANIIRTNITNNQIKIK